MSRDHDDDSPKCLLCSEPRDGQRYQFWGGTYLDTKKQRPLFSSTTYITSRYRDMKRVGAFVCHGCVRRAMILSSLPSVVLLGLATAGCLAVAAGGPSQSKLVFWVFAALAGLFGLGTAVSIALPFFPNLVWWTSDKVIRDRVAPILKRKGKGNSFFTEREYEVLFTTKPADRPETAADLLATIGEGDEEEDYRRSRPRGGGGASPAAVTRCPNCAKATPARPAAKECKWCQTPLP